MPIFYQNVKHFGEMKYTCILRQFTLSHLKADGAIWYEACKDIPQGTELLVWYGDCYLQFMGVPVALKEMADGGAQEEADSEFLLFGFLEHFYTSSLSHSGCLPDWLCFSRLYSLFVCLFVGLFMILIPCSFFISLLILLV